MKAILYFFIPIGLVSCQQTTSNEPTKTDTIRIKPASISEDRTNPSKKPIATYSVPVDDGMGNLNNWKFAVNIYETSKTFAYKINIVYKEIRVNEKMQIPNMNVVPIVSIKNGHYALECIIGFDDATGKFKEYYKVSVKNDRLNFKKTNSYAVVKYSTKK